MTNHKTIYLAECGAADGLHNDTCILSAHTTKRGARTASIEHVSEVGLDNPEDYAVVRAMELLDDEGGA